MRRAEFITAIILALFSIYLMWKSGEGPEWDTEYVRFTNVGVNIDGSGPGKGFWPFYLSGAMLLSCIWIIVNAIRRTSPPSQSDEPFMDGYSKRMMLLVGGGLIGFLTLIGIIGFYGAIFVFLFYYLFFLGRHGIGQTLAISIGVPVFSFFFFDVLMRIVLPKGYTEPLFLPLYEIFL